LAKSPQCSTASPINQLADEEEDESNAKKIRTLETPMSFAAPPVHHYPFGSLGIDPTVWYQWATTASRSSAFKPWQTASGELVSDANPGGTLHEDAPHRSISIASSTKTHKRLALGHHSNSLDSSEDALSSTSTMSSIMSERADFEDQTHEDLQHCMVDLGGFYRVFDDHNVSAKVRKDILQEAVKIIQNYQRIVTSLAKQKRLLEKELDNAAGHVSPGHEALASHRTTAPARDVTTELRIRAEKARKLFRVKEEPLEEEAQSAELSAQSSKNIELSIAESRSLIVA